MFCSISFGQITSPLKIKRINFDSCGNYKNTTQVFIDTARFLKPIIGALTGTASGNLVPADTGTLKTSMLAASNIWTGQNEFRNSTNDVAFDSIYGGTGTFTNRVGIGTATPAYPLEVLKNSVGEQFQLNLSDQTAKTWSTSVRDGIRFNSRFTGQGSDWVCGNINYGYSASYDAGGATMAFDLVNAAGSVANMMTIKGSGKVGIGRSVPTQELDVNGTITATKIFLGTGTPSIPFEVATTYPQMRLRSMSDAEAQYSGIQYYDSSNTIGGGFYLNGARSTGYGGLYSLNLIQIKNYPLTLSTNNTVRMTITGAGATIFTGSITIGGGTAIAKVLRATATLDFPSISANGGQQDLTITVTGATAGTSCFLGLPTAPTAGITFDCFVNATNTVTVRATNCTTGAIDPASATYETTVFNF